MEVGDIFNKTHWDIISKRVSEKAIVVFPYLRDKKLKSAVLSNLFENVSAEYFTSIGIRCNPAESDKDPDLYFPKLEKPVEIKVTGLDSWDSKKIAWMGGKYSKRTADFILVAWYYNDFKNSLFDDDEAEIRFYMVNTFIEQSEWNVISDDSYYATKFTSEQLKNKEYTVLLGEERHEVFFLHTAPEKKLGISKSCWKPQKIKN